MVQPPFNLKVKTKVGMEFIRAIYDSFPKGHPLRPICNHHTLKHSYSCMPSMESKIKRHNKKVKASQDKPKKPEKKMQLHKGRMPTR